MDAPLAAGGILEPGAELHAAVAGGAIQHSEFLEMASAGRVRISTGRPRSSPMPPPNPALASIAARLVQARQAAGLATSDAAAIRLGMNPKVYATHEQGRSGVKPAELRRYAEAFGVSHGWLSTGIGAAPRKAG